MNGNNFLQLLLGGGQQQGMNLPGVVAQQGQNQQDQLGMLISAFGPQASKIRQSSNNARPGLDSWYAMNPNARPGEFDPTGTKAGRRRTIDIATGDLSGQNAMLTEQIYNQFLQNQLGDLRRQGQQPAQPPVQDNGFPQQGGDNVQYNMARMLEQLAGQNGAQVPPGFTPGPAAGGVGTQPNGGAPSRSQLIGGSPGAAFAPPPVMNGGEGAQGFPPASQQQPQAPRLPAQGPMNGPMTPQQNYSINDAFGANPLQGTSGMGKLQGTAATPDMMWAVDSVQGMGPTFGPQFPPLQGTASTPDMVYQVDDVQGYGQQRGPALPPGGLAWAQMLEQLLNQLFGPQQQQQPQQQQNGFAQSFPF